jgi:hypothetical protein
LEAGFESLTGDRDNRYLTPDTSRAPTGRDRNRGR